jgi:serine/threonine-protein kinase
VGHESSTLPHIGDLIDGRYRIDRILGEGGTSTVYQVSHIITDKKFAIKWLLPELALDEAAVDRFIQEARVGGRFSHPYAVQVYDICKANDSFYMLMEFLEGESLQARLERVGRLPVAAVCAIALICTEVLRAAHQAGIVHRDLKPANIFLCAATDLRGEIPKVLDFGISTFCAELQHAGATSVIGTPLYMAPEQMLGEAADPRTDIYALGAVLYELVSGRPPFHADSYADLVAQVTGDATPASLDVLADTDPAFSAIVTKAMAREPSARFASMRELGQALSRFATEKGITPSLRPSEAGGASHLARHAPESHETPPPELSGPSRDVHSERASSEQPTSEDLAAAWHAEAAPIRAARRRRFGAITVSLGAIIAFMAVDWRAHEQRSPGDAAPRAAIPAPLGLDLLEQDAHAHPDEAPGQTLARLELATEPVALALDNESSNAPAAAARRTPRAGNAPRLNPDAATAAKAEPAHVRKPSSRELVVTSRASADQSQTVSHTTGVPASARPANVAHAGPAVTTPAVRVKRSDFSGDAPAATRIPAAGVSRQDF